MSSIESHIIGNISDFTLKKYLGKGAFGKVQLYSHNDTNKEYAIKLIPKHLVEEYGINIDEEVNIMKDLNHMNLLRLYRKINSNHEYGIVLEYCEDGDLQSLIKKKKKFSEKESLVVLYQILNGIKYLHEKDYLHRDLKPANIMITNGLIKPIIKITDFGLSRNLSGASMLSTRAGTPLYMSPELLEGERYDNRADVWSIGCIFYEMLTGSIPYDAISETQLYKKIMNEKLNLPEGLSAVSVQLLLKSLDKDVNTRATVSELYNIVLDYVGKEIEDVKKNGKKSHQDDDKAEAEDYLISKEYDNEIMLEYYKMKLKDKENVNNEEMLLKLGMLYEEKKDYVSMKKYYFQLDRLSLGNEEVKIRLGRYYIEVEKDYDMAKKYNVPLLSDELNKLGNKKRELNQYEEMKKYYLMAIELGNSDAKVKLKILNENLEKSKKLENLNENIEESKKLKNKMNFNILIFFFIFFILFFIYIFNFYNF